MNDNKLSQIMAKKARIKKLGGQGAVWTTGGVWGGVWVLLKEYLETLPSEIPKSFNLTPFQKPGFI